MSVLIDTGVWLGFFRGERKGLVARPWIVSGEAMVHPFVFGELLLGGLSSENDTLMHSLAWCDAATPGEVCDFIRRSGLAGKGVGWVDAALLATAQDAQAPLATYDSRLARCAQKLGIATPVEHP